MPEPSASLEKFQTAVERGDAETLDRLLSDDASLRTHLEDPLFAFDAPALVRAAGHPNAPALLPVLVRHGADPNARSRWWAGGFSALDAAQGETVDLLLGLGARWDVWSAAAHGRTEILRELLDADPSLVDAPGGDGQRPLHFAKTTEVAELLLARGADLEARDVDHESTPAQYQTVHPEVLRLLVQKGARPDAFIAAVLDDPSLPVDPDVRVGEAPFVTVASEGGHIYVYRFGHGATPHTVAAMRGNQKVLEAWRGMLPARDLIAAAWREDETAVEDSSPAEPSFAPEDHAAVAQAAQQGRTEVVRLLLRAGLDPTAPGMDSGSALHVAAWFGWSEVVRLLASRVPLDLLDAHHGSPPLGWAAHGARFCRNPKGDYPAVVQALLEAGADPKVPANRDGATMLEQAGDREDVKGILREATEGFPSSTSSTS